MALSPAIEAAKNEFAAKHGLPQAAPRTLEAFFTHHILLHRNLSDFAAQQTWQQENKILVGGVNDSQLDAIVVLLNNEIVIRPGDPLDVLEQAVANEEPLQVSFVFIQATGSSDPVTHKMSSFSDGVYGFFDPTDLSAALNKGVLEWIELKNRIFAILEEGDLGACCECAMYFVSSRKISADENIESTSRRATSKIMNHKDLARFFYSVEFHRIDGERIQRMIAAPGERRANLTVSASKFVQAPPSDRLVDACYFGYLSAREVLCLISEMDEDEIKAKGLRPGIFATNIRSFVGMGTSVNSSIAETLRDPRQRRQFGLRSNGLAIIARSCHQLPEGRIRFAGAQIVNGCQTSHVIFSMRAALGGDTAEDVWLPAKIIVTDDKDIEDAAILALNRQTPIHEAQLFTERSFVDRLAYELAQGELTSQFKLHLEKREGEYNGRDDVAEDGILTLYDIAGAYVAAFLGKPEDVSRGGRKPIIDKIRQGMIFGKEEDVLPYALCAVMIYWERAVVKRRSPKRWKKYAMRNMVLHAMRLCAEKAVQLTLPPENAPAKEKTAYFSALHRLFCNPEKADALADIAYDVVNNACAGKHMKMDSQSARDPELTLEIASQVNKLKLPKNL